MMGQDPQMQHIGIGKDERSAFPEACPQVRGGVPVIDSAADLALPGRMAFSLVIRPAIFCC
jgi:hypothetical protein